MQAKALQADQMTAEVAILRRLMAQQVAAASGTPSSAHSPLNSLSNSGARSQTTSLGGAVVAAAAAIAAPSVAAVAYEASLSPGAAEGSTVEAVIAVAHPVPSAPGQESHPSTVEDDWHLVQGPVERSAEAAALSFTAGPPSPSGLSTDRGSSVILAAHLDEVRAEVGIKNLAVA